MAGSRSNVTPIIVAQACTVLGGPALAATLLYLGTRKELAGEKRVPRWMLILGFVGFLVVCLLAWRTGTALVAKLVG